MRLIVVNIPKQNDVETTRWWRCYVYIARQRHRVRGTCELRLPDGAFPPPQSLFVLCLLMHFQEFHNNLSIENSITLRMRIGLAALPEIAYGCDATDSGFARYYGFPVFIGLWKRGKDEGVLSTSCLR